MEVDTGPVVENEVNDQTKNEDDIEVHQVAVIVASKSDADEFKHRQSLATLDLPFQASFPVTFRLLKTCQVTCVCHMICGAALVVLGSLALWADTTNAQIASGIWAGVIVLAAGSYGIFTWRAIHKLDKLQVAVYLGLCLIGLIACIAVLTLHLWALVEDQEEDEGTKLLAISLLLVVFAAVETIIVVLSVVIAAKVLIQWNSKQDLRIHSIEKKSFSDLDQKGSLSENTYTPDLSTDRRAQTDGRPPAALPRPTTPVYIEPDEESVDNPIYETLDYSQVKVPEDQTYEGIDSEDDTEQIVSSARNPSLDGYLVPTLMSHENNAFINT